MKKQIEKESRHMCETFHNLKEQGFLKNVRKEREVMYITAMVARRLQ